jgi:hypothetical protein
MWIDWMAGNQVKARVFISCGQNKDRERYEVIIAEKIAARISDMGSNLILLFRNKG